MHSSNMLLLCLIGLVGLCFALPSETNGKVHGSFGQSQCTATLKNPDKKTASKFYWKVWKQKGTPWQYRFIKNATGIYPLSLYTDSTPQCEVALAIDLKTCTVHYGDQETTTATSEIEKHTTEPSPILLPGKPSTDKDTISAIPPS
ncbi:hypothetical protein PCANC_06059 [Puccinia coronata f. sp. avenae]|uniref:Ig-like domain-containing protein n=1 Tax=Puccinia coronata f. sp. avenae TaxID=200324 RepID=A0A2N5SC12_9BASI|nr:hypothetical protein PCASD_22350 [Puccinia coronata f. sp. avenae]PLW20640.1 hypothetical protein PCANC_06059 [Puccinia coronata f. sp. avenae]PLW47204.1 hypothetical protein PCASD_02343 [Puccinia coronata f. sp. avenae]